MIQIKKTEQPYPSNLTLNYVLQNLCLEDPTLKFIITEDKENWYIKVEYMEEEEDEENNNNIDNA